MDFARKQLEKYGWTDGKGLGRHENGISEALKPKIKRSVAGVGHDPASEFNEHWWTALYDKAAGNVEVENKNGRTKKIKTKDEQEFTITNSTWKLNKKPNKAEDDEQYSDYFVRTAVLSGGSKTEKVRESDSEEEEKKDVFKMTDEELFKACEGRTAHKGARHGLKALGKLARIAQQEAMLLAQPKYSDYSHAKNMKEKIRVVEDMSLNSDSEDARPKKKKKKRKRCNSNEVSITYNVQSTNAVVVKSIEESDIKKSQMTDNDGVASLVEENGDCGKSKDKNGEDCHISYNMDIDTECKLMSKKKKKRKVVEEIDDSMNTEEFQSSAVESLHIKKNKKKKKNVE